MKHYIILLAALVLSAANATAQTKRSARILNTLLALLQSLVAIIDIAELCVEFSLLGNKLLNSSHMILLL